ncbi:DotH/IcmK family type IV secretion protein [Teredinibacter purpureus]|uniref:DotH/IcmK family type IV secretion protein n=1 Tax=Teredinibacter purpureus TaxID=2731756 RepID=UPI0005F80EF9|nr:DotH/IcmK family type IV secretion protein [Teredinibacter purpureus]
MASESIHNGKEVYVDSSGRVIDADGNAVLTSDGREVFIDENGNLVNKDGAMIDEKLLDKIEVRKVRDGEVSSINQLTDANGQAVFTIDNVASDSVLKDIVLGIAPENYEKMETSDSNVEAWRFKESLFIRTIYSPSSPLPRGIHHGPSGYTAYRLNDMPILVMTSSDGYEKKITIKRGVK